MKIAKILEVDITELLPTTKGNVFEIHDNENCANGYIEHYNSDARELYEKLLLEKDKIIDLLQAQINKQKKD